MPARRAYRQPGPPIRPADGREWRDFLFIRSNPKGVHFERWRHINGCARFFNAARETVGDKFLSTYKAGEPRPDITSLTGRRQMTTYRLPNRGRVDHGKPVTFTVDGKSYKGPCRRHPRLGAARERRPPDGPLVQNTTARAAWSPPAPTSRTRS